MDRPRHHQPESDGEDARAGIPPMTEADDRRCPHRMRRPPWRRSLLESRQRRPSPRTTAATNAPKARIDAVGGGSDADYLDVGDNRKCRSSSLA